MANVITAGNSSNGGTAITTDTSGTLNIVTGSGSGSNAITIDGSQAVTMPGNLTVTGTLTAGSVTNTTGSFSGNLSFNSGYGSAAIAYGCRAWVCFNGTGTVAIRASGNVSSITDINTGRFTVNFTNAMPDSNYCMSFNFSSTNNNTNEPIESSDTVRTSSSVSVTSLSAGSYYDSIYNSVSIHR